MRTYLDLLAEVRHHGLKKQDRTGTGTLSLFGRQIRFDLSQGFPAVTTKKLHFKSIFGELLWFLAGKTNVEWLHAQGVTIWDEWANSEGELGPIYGAQWRSWRCPDGSTVDQIQQVVQSLREDPDSRRHLVTAWNPGELSQMALSPCHALFQFYVGENQLSCQLYQRSADLFLGVPFNIASYATLTMMMAQVCGYQVGEFVHTFGDVHIYSNHLEQVDLQLSREPHPLPQLRLNPRRKQLEEFVLEDFEIVNYQHHPPIKAPVAV